MVNDFQFNKVALNHCLSCLRNIFTVGNKIDEPAELREVTHAEGQAQAAEWGVQFMETSAKTNHNVTELFQVRVGEQSKNKKKSFTSFFFYSILGTPKHGEKPKRVTTRQ